MFKNYYFHEKGILSIDFYLNKHSSNKCQIGMTEWLRKVLQILMTFVSLHVVVGKLQSLELN